MNLDIKTGILAASLLALLGGLISFWTGIRAIRSGSRLNYFRKRRERLTRGWRLVVISVFFAGAAIAIGRLGEPVAYQFFPPSPTVTDTPTITNTPTISLTPTISETPTITNTPSITDTPSMPMAIETQFQSTITPNPDAIFSALIFASKLDKNFTPLDPAVEFANPIDRLYGVFSYDKMTRGAQWSALWYRGNELICFETIPWDGGTGGFGYTECGNPVGGWQPGDYEVQIFTGTSWKSLGGFSRSPARLLPRTIRPPPPARPSPLPPLAPAPRCQARRPRSRLRPPSPPPSRVPARRPTRVVPPTRAGRRYSLPLSPRDPGNLWI